VLNEDALGGADPRPPLMGDRPCGLNDRARAEMLARGEDPVADLAGLNAGLSTPAGG
jgi:hypothetical protein